MNKVILLGNLTRDPERRVTNNNNSVTSFTVAVSKGKKDADGKYTAEYINCVAWRLQADLVAKYFKKGSPICLEGKLQTSSYTDKNGDKRYKTEVVVDTIEFIRGLQNAEEPKEDPIPSQEVPGDFLGEGFTPADLDDNELPF